MKLNTLRVADIGLRVIPAVLVMAMAAGCQSSQEAAPGATGEIAVIHGQEPPETPQLIFVDVDFFAIRAWQHSQLDRMVSEHARSIGADTAYVRITEDSSSEIRYTVTTYRHR